MPCKQYKLIHKDGLRISTYVARTFDGAARSSHLRKDNYFYYNCCTARFARDNCPSYLVKENFTALKNGLIDNLTIATGTFMDALTSRTYTKVRAHAMMHASPSTCLHLPELDYYIEGPRLHVGELHLGEATEKEPVCAVSVWL